MKKLKIAIDARTLGSRPSGVGMYLNDFLEQLIKYDEFEWVLFTDVKESEYIKRFEARGISVIAWGKPVYKSVGVYAYFAFIKKALKQVKPDIFWEVNSIIPVNLGKNFKTLITIHDMFPIQYVRYFGKIYIKEYKRYQNDYQEQTYHFKTDLQQFPLHIHRRIYIYNVSGYE